MHFSIFHSSDPWPGCEQGHTGASRRVKRKISCRHCHPWQALILGDRRGTAGSSISTLQGSKLLLPGQHSRGTGDCSGSWEGPGWARCGCSPLRDPLPPPGGSPHLGHSERPFCNAGKEEQEEDFKELGDLRILLQGRSLLERVNWNLALPHIQGITTECSTD